jgi:hypothetical protein
MPDLRFTWGQLRLIGAMLGLADDDPPPTAAMIIAGMEAGRIVATEYEHVMLFGFDGDDD